MEAALKMSRIYSVVSCMIDYYEIIFEVLLDKFLLRL